MSGATPNNEDVAGTGGYEDLNGVWHPFPVLKKIEISPPNLDLPLDLPPVKDKFSPVVVPPKPELDSRLSLWEKAWYLGLPPIKKYIVPIVRIISRNTIVGKAIDIVQLITTGDSMTPKNINIVTNIIAILLVILPPIHDYLVSQPFSVGTFIICVLGAVVSYFTGKSALSLQTSGGK